MFCTAFSCSFNLCNQKGSKRGQSEMATRRKKTFEFGGLCYIKANHTNSINVVSPVTEEVCVVSMATAHMVTVFFRKLMLADVAFEVAVLRGLCFCVRRIL